MTPVAGDFGVTSTSGWVAWVIRTVTRSSVNHAFLYLGAGSILEADPNGGISPGTSNEYPQAVWSDVALTDVQRAAICKWGLQHRGVPYNFVDIAALLYAKTIARLQPRWAVPHSIRARLSTDRRMICSQFVDAAYRAAGVQLFTDDRLSGDVTPGDLLDVIRH